MQGYSADLAFIHDVGFSDYAAESGPGLLEILRKHHLRPGGVVIDLGCGSGVWAARLVGAGYSVIGVDLSAPMLELARKNAPGARFEEGSLYAYEPPACDAVTCLGECMNYCFAGDVRIGDLDRLFDRVYDALRPGGVFVFDFAEPSEPGSRQFHRVGKDWAAMADDVEDGNRLTRRIVSFRADGDHWRRTEETHILRLFPKDQVLQRARASGFHVRAGRSIGRFALPPAHVSVIAQKRARRNTPVKTGRDTSGAK